MLVSAAAAPRAWIGRDGLRRAAMTAVAALACAIVLLPFLWPYYLANRRSGWSGRSTTWRTTRPSGATTSPPAAASTTRSGAIACSTQDAALSGPHGARAGGRGAGRPPTPGAGIAPAPWWRWRCAGVVCRSAPLCRATTGSTITCPLLQGIRGVVRFGWLWLLALAVLAGVGLAQPRTAVAGPRHDAGDRCRDAGHGGGGAHADGLHPVRGHPADLRARGGLLQTPCWPSSRSPIRRSCRTTVPTSSPPPPTSRRCSTATAASPRPPTSSTRPWPGGFRRPSRCASSAYLGVTHIVVHVARIGHGPLEQLEATGLVRLHRRGGHRPALRAGAGKRRELAPAGGGTGRRGGAGRAAHLAAGARRVRPVAPRQRRHRAEHLDRGVGRPSAAARSHGSCSTRRSSTPNAGRWPTPSTCWRKARWPCRCAPPGSPRRRPTTCSCSPVSPSAPGRCGGWRRPGPVTPPPARWPAVRSPSTPTS